MSFLPTPDVADHSTRSKAVIQLARLMGTKLTRERLDAYLESLAELPTAVVVQGCARAGKELERNVLPMPKVIRRLGEETVRSGKGTPPASARAATAPMTAEGWLAAFDLEPRIEWLERSPGRKRLEQAAEEAATCGRRDACREGTCCEQIPVPRTHQDDWGQPPLLVIAYGWCPEHETRCAWRKGQRG